MAKSQIFLGYFRSVMEHECTVDVELKNELTISGKLQFIDNNMCMLLGVDEVQLSKLPPQFAGMSAGIYIRGSTIRTVYLPKIEADLDNLTLLCKDN